MKPRDKMTAKDVAEEWHDRNRAALEDREAAVAALLPLAVNQLLIDAVRRLLRGDKIVAFFCHECLGGGITGNTLEIPPSVATKATSYLPLSCHAHIGGERITEQRPR